MISALTQDAERWVLQRPSAHCVRWTPREITIRRTVRSVHTQMGNLTVRSRTK
jgi:hypothetical protein